MKLFAIPMTLREANDFVSMYHRHSSRTARDGGRFAVGASDLEGCWGVAIVGRPLSRLLDDGRTAEVLRCCTREGAPRGTNSFLYGCCWRAWRAMGGGRLVTYTLMTESGASLRGAGWSVVAETRPGAWDRETRPRKWRGIYEQPKLRWEKEAVE